MKLPFFASVAAGVVALMQANPAGAQASPPAPEMASGDIYTDAAMRACTNGMQVSQQSQGQPYFEMFNRDPAARVWCRFVANPQTGLSTLAFFDANEFRANPNVDMADMRSLLQIQADTRNHTFAVLKRAPGETIAGAIEISNLGQSNQSVTRSTVITRGTITQAGDGPFMGSAANAAQANLGIGLLNGLQTWARNFQCGRPVAPNLPQTPCR